MCVHVPSTRVRGRARVETRARAVYSEPVYSAPKYPPAFLMSKRRWKLDLDVVPLVAQLVGLLQDIVEGLVS